MAEGRSLFERLGGEAAIEAAVVRFYDKVIADPLTAPFFARLDLPTQIRKQISFMARAFGAPKAYQGRDLRTAHQKLVHEDGLSDAHFDAVARHLKATLQELGIADDLIAECLAIVGSVRNEVLDR
jgi:hemoglobin